MGPLCTARDREKDLSNESNVLEKVISLRLLAFALLSPSSAPRGVNRERSYMIRCRFEYAAQPPSASQQMLIKVRQRILDSLRQCFS